MSSLSPPSSLAHDPVRIAYAYARQMGMSREDGYDCALDFRLHLLHDSRMQSANAAYLHRCARNYVSNCLRATRRRQQRERCYAEHNTAGAVCIAAFPAPGPRTLILRKALWEQVFAMLKQFTPEQRDLFVRYHVRQQSLSDLAERTGRTLPATSQALYHIHRRLSRLLLAQGWSGEDARQLCASSLLPGFPRPRPSPI